MMARTFSLKSKVLLSFLCIALLAVSACIYGIYRFNALEQRMQVVNEEYVPTLKVLNQAESSLFLLESDLDKSLEEGILRPKDGSLQVLQARLDSLVRLSTVYRDNNFDLHGGVLSAEAAYRHLNSVLDQLYGDWGDRAVHASDLTESRNQFRFQLKMLVRDVDREIRLITIGVQNDISRSGIVVTLLLALCIILAFLMTYWISRSLEPLAELTEQMRRISESGLESSKAGELKVNALGDDEIAVLSREFNKMASSLLDQTKQLNAQKKNLEYAHLEMAKQNVALRKAQAKLLHSEKLGLVGRLSAQMAHEIRNPLNALGLHIELLEEQLRRSGSAHAALDPIRREVDRLMNVSKSYLDLARAPKLEPTSQNINDLVEELEEFYTPLFSEKKIKLFCELGDVPDSAVDKAQFSQVLGNLLKNSMEALDLIHDSRVKSIRLQTKFDIEKRQIILSVSDNGVGIEKLDQEAIFSPFYTNKAEGTGLGLAYSKQVVETHGGDIAFESIKNEGTKFTLILPVLH